MARRFSQIRQIFTDFYNVMLVTLYTKFFAVYRFLTNYVRNDNIASFRGDRLGIYNFKRFNSQCTYIGFVIASRVFGGAAISGESQPTRLQIDAPCRRLLRQKTPRNDS